MGFFCCMLPNEGIDGLILILSASMKTVCKETFITQSLKQGLNSIGRNLWKRMCVLIIRCSFCYILLKTTPRFLSRSTQVVFWIVVRRLGVVPDCHLGIIHGLSIVGIFSHGLSIINLEFIYGSLCEPPRISSRFPIFKTTLAQSFFQ